MTMSNKTMTKTYFITFRGTAAPEEFATAPVVARYSADHIVNSSRFAGYGHATGFGTLDPAVVCRVETTLSRRELEARPEVVRVRTVLLFRPSEYRGTGFRRLVEDLLLE